MRILIKMISPIGIRQSRRNPSVLNNSGFTFIEIMVTLVVLSIGLASIFKAFFYSLDQINYLQHRLYAVNLLEDRLAEVQKMFKAYQVIPMDQSEDIYYELGSEKINFNQHTQISAVDNLTGILNVQITFSWAEHGRPVSISRAAYMSSLGEIKNN